MGIPNWRRSLPSSSSGVNPPTRPSPRSWDAFDGRQLHREPKRPRTDGKSQGVLGSFHRLRVQDSQPVVLEQVSPVLTTYGEVLLLRVELLSVMPVVFLSVIGLDTICT